MSTAKSLNALRVIEILTAWEKILPTSGARAPEIMKNHYFHDVGHQRSIFSELGHERVARQSHETITIVSGIAQSIL